MITERDVPEPELELDIGNTANRIEDIQVTQSLTVSHDNATAADDRDLDTGWAWVVLVASFGTCCILGGALFTVGIIHSILLERYEGSSSLTALAGALHTALISLAGPLSSAVSDRFSCRVAIVAAGFTYTVGYMATAFAPNIETAIISCGLIAGTAGGLALTANTVVVTYYFRKKRNLALGISNSGIGVGLFIFAPLMQYLRDFYGPAGFFIIMAGIFSNIITLGTLCFPSRLEISTKELRRSEHRKCSDGMAYKPIKCTLLQRYWTVLTNKGICCLCVANFSYCMALYLMYLHFPKFIVYKGFSSEQAALFISISGIFNVLGRIFSGILANCTRVHEICIYAGTMGVVSVISFIYPFIAQYYFGQVVYFVLLGLFVGPSAVVATCVSLKFVSVNYIPTALGLQLSSAGIGAIVGPVLTGMLIDHGCSYEVVIMLAACFVMVATVIGGVTICLTHGQIHDEYCVVVDDINLR